METPIFGWRIWMVPMSSAPEFFMIGIIKASLCSTSWLVVWNHGIWWLSIQLGISSSQLTLTPSFFRGLGLNHQPVFLSHYYPILIHIKPYKPILKPYIWNHQPSFFRRSITNQQGFSSFPPGATHQAYMEETLLEMLAFHHGKMAELTHRIRGPVR